MLKGFLVFLLCGIIMQAGAQIQFAKLTGKNSGDYKTGYGGYLKFSYPVSEASAVSLEVGALIFTSKIDSRFGWDVVPVKAGYRYTFNNTGSGLYVEPQVGYNVYGIKPDDAKFTGLILGAGTGYLFQPIGGIQFDLGIRYETVQFSGGSLNYFSLRLAHNFSIRKREE